jgi:hypothetical protein
MLNFETAPTHSRLRPIASFVIASGVDLMPLCGAHPEDPVTP